jgi:hypothetical protein
MSERCEGVRPRVTRASVPEYLSQSTCTLAPPLLRSHMLVTPGRTDAEPFCFRCSVPTSPGRPTDPRPE